jgi:fermentation-respiration switch protein FrsA (DUF1100 family)
MSPIADFDSYVYDSAESYISGNRVLGKLPLPRLPGFWSPFFVWFTEQRLSIPAVPAAEDVVSQIAPRPLLIIHGTNDTVVLPDHAQRLYDAAAQPKELWLVDGGTHDHIYTDFPQQFESRVGDFLTQTLLT